MVNSPSYPIAWNFLWKIPNIDWLIFRRVKRALIKRKFLDSNNLKILWSLSKIISDKWIKNKFKKFCDWTHHNISSLRNNHIIKFILEAPYSIDSQICFCQARNSFQISSLHVRAIAQDLYRSNSTLSWVLLACMGDHLQLMSLTGWSLKLSASSMHLISPHSCPFEVMLWCCFSLSFTGSILVGARRS